MKYVGYALLAWIVYIYATTDHWDSPEWKAALMDMADALHATADAMAH